MDKNIIVGFDGVDAVEDLVVQEEEQREELLAMEDDLLRGLLMAAKERETETVTIEIARKGKVLFRFRIRGLTEDEYTSCREKATHYVVNRRLGGIKIPQDTNTALFRSFLIYTATVEEDRKRLWDNKKAWEMLNVLSGPELIDKVLLAGEKDAIVEKIDQMSGFSSDLEETAKN